MPSSCDRQCPAPRRECIIPVWRENDCRLLPIRAGIASERVPKSTRFRRSTARNQQPPMHTFAAIGSKLLICLTALAMPFQASWAESCGCPVGEESPHAAAEPFPANCCSKEIEAKPTCRSADSTMPTCCGAACEPNRDSCCGCGPECACVQRDESSTRPPMPAPGNGRSQTSLAFSVVPMVAIHIPVVDGDGRSFPAETDSALCEPGARICVLLCRFTL